MIRKLITAIRVAIATPRYVCGVCGERTHYPDAHVAVNHAGDPT